MMRLYTIEGITERSRVQHMSDELGFDLAADPPWTNGVRATTWVRGDEHLTYFTHAPSGEALLRVEVENENEEATLIEKLSAVPAEETLSAVDVRLPPVNQIATFYRLGLLLVAADDELVRRVFEAQARYLESSEMLVRWAAARALENSAIPSVATALEKAAKQHPELTPVFEYVREACDAAEDGTLHDGPTDSHRELIRRAKEGVEKGQWRRVEKATDDLFQSKIRHPEGLYLRSVFYEATDRPLLAYALLGAASEAERLDARLDDDEADGDAPVDEPTPLRTEIDAARARLEDLIDGPANDDDVRETESWFERWSHDELYDGVALSYGAAKALIGRMAPLEGLLIYVAGAYNLEIPLLERAQALVPDSPACLRNLGSAHFKINSRDEATRFFLKALEGLRSDEPLSVDAQRIETLDNREPLHTHQSTLLEDLATIAYEAERWEEAASYADELVEVDRSSLRGWQLRANARTFALRHEEAVTAYEEALAELDRSYSNEDSWMIGDDPRPLMQNNLSAVLAKLGRREESLDALRMAVRGDAKWGAEAHEDDYFEALWDDPEFLAITSADPRELVTSDEKTPDAIDGLIMRSIGLFYRGQVDPALDAASRAAEIAQWEGLVELEARALAAWGSALAFSSAPGQALEHLTKAASLVEAQEVSSEVRAETIHNYGVALHQAGQFDEAQEAYERALDLRQAHYGSDHPVIAKSFGDMSRLAEVKGAPTEEVRNYLDRGIAILEGALERMSTDADARDDRIEALVDCGTQKINVAHVLLREGCFEEAIDAVEGGVNHLDDVTAHDGVLNPSFLENALELVESIIRTADNDAILRLADPLYNRLDELLIPGPIEERKERHYWRGLRRFADSMRLEGVHDEEIAKVFSQALRGGDELSPDLLAVPEIGGFAKALAERTVKEPTLLITAAMALETARATGDFDEALEQLEGLCMAALYASES